MAELSISPITIKILCPFLLGILRAPIFTKINRLAAPMAIIENMTTRRAVIPIASSVAGNPKTFPIS